MGAASSMLDLSFKGHKASEAYPIGLPQYPPGAVASRTRHSLAILSHFHSSSGGSQLTPRSSFRRRPPSVASYHHLYGVNGTPQANSRYPQYLFGGMSASAKSETTLNMTPVSHGHQSPSFKNPYFLRKIKETEVENELLTFKAFSGSSQNLSGHFVQSGDISLSPSPTKGLSRGGGSKAGSGIRDIFSGITGGARSSFKRRSVRKCGSDASAFLSSRKSTPNNSSNNNNKRNSQLAHNQLSSILYNNFYVKKFGPTTNNTTAAAANNTGNYGSQSTLLMENELAVSAASGEGAGGGHLSSRHLSYDFGNAAHHQASSHVYLPNVTSPLHHRGSRYQQSGGGHHHHHQLEARSASCAQLNQLNRADSPAGHYHNHLLNKQFDSPKLRLDKSCGKLQYYLLMSSQSNKIVSMYYKAEEEHIYASLPEVEEDEELLETNKTGQAAKPLPLPPTTTVEGSFSARSTLPEDYHLGASEAAAPVTHSSSSSSTVNETEDIYEEVNILIENEKAKLRSQSQDTLVDFKVKMEEVDEDEDGRVGDEEDEDDEDDDENNADLVSMMSEISSSSTFSSFTTCANQDFEFIVSQSSSSGSSGNSSSADNNSSGEATSTLKREKKKKKNANTSNEEETKAAPLEPSNLSMAAMYYSRFMVNEGGHEKKEALRQRPKLDRRQSFSTAYELRQRILQEQQQQLNESYPHAKIIEEEEEEGAGIEQNMLDDMFASSRLNRRICNSEDNLLSIISTIANCGDEGVAGGVDNGSHEIVTKVDETKVNAGKPKNGTLVLKKEGKASTKATVNVRKVSHLPKPTPMVTIRPFVSTTSSASPIKTVATASTTTNGNISIKELKSKRQQIPKKVTPSTGVAVKVLKTTSSTPTAELGSLWANKTAGRKSTALATTPSSALAKSTPSLASSSPSSNRVPTFITTSVGVSQLATPSRGSRLPMPTTAAATTSAATTKQKQNLRQNAMLAKNALLSSGIEGK